MDEICATYGIQDMQGVNVRWEGHMTDVRSIAAIREITSVKVERVVSLKWLEIRVQHIAICSCDKHRMDSIKLGPKVVERQGTQARQLHVLAEISNVALRTRSPIACL